MQRLLFNNPLDEPFSDCQMCFCLGGHLGDTAWGFGCWFGINLVTYAIFIPLVDNLCRLNDRLVSNVRLLVINCFEPLHLAQWLTSILSFLNFVLVLLKFDPLELCAAEAFWRWFPHLVGSHHLFAGLPIITLLRRLFSCRIMEAHDEFYEVPSVVISQKLIVGSF